MGSGASVQDEIPKEWMDIFKAMKLKPKEVGKLFAIYNTVDADRSGSIDVAELLMFMDIERTLFTKRIFEAFDKDHTHRVDFYEFVVSVWKFCALGKEATCVFAFDLYDLNADGKLTSAEVAQMFRELMGAKTLEQEAISRVLNNLLKYAAENDGFITVDYFRTFTTAHQALLQPVFGIQNMLRISTLGESFWRKMSKRRIELRPGVWVPLSELMVLHAHRKVFGAMMEDKQSINRVSSMMRIVLDNTDSAHVKEAIKEDKLVLKNTKILNPFTALLAARKPVAPPPVVMVHGNIFVPPTPKSPNTSKRVAPSTSSSNGSNGIVNHTFVSGGGGGGSSSPAAPRSPHYSPRDSPRSTSPGPGSTSPGQHVHGKKTMHHNNNNNNNNDKQDSAHHHHHHNPHHHHHHHNPHSHSHSHSHSHHHGGGGGGGSVSSVGSGHSKEKEHNSSHHSPHHQHNNHHSKQGGDREHSSHRSAHSHGSDHSSTSVHKHLTPQQLLQNHPNAKRTTLDKPL